MINFFPYISLAFFKIVYNVHKLFLQWGNIKCSKDISCISLLGIFFFTSVTLRKSREHFYVIWCRTRTKSNINEITEKWTKIKYNILKSMLWDLHSLKDISSKILINYKGKDSNLTVEKSRRHPLKWSRSTLPVKRHQPHDLLDKSHWEGHNVISVIFLPKMCTHILI